jgi:hypothetical protein
VIWLTYVNHFKDREIKQAKDADKPELKSYRPGSETNDFSDTDVASTVYWWSLSHLKGIYTKRGKPNYLHENGNRTARGGDR